MQFDADEALTTILGKVNADSVIVARDMHEQMPAVHRVTFTATPPHRRTAVILAADEWFKLRIGDGLDVGTTLFDYADSEKSSSLEELIRVALVYLRGGGEVVHRRRWLSRRKDPRLVINVNGRTWELGRSVSVVPYP